MSRRLVFFVHVTGDTPHYGDIWRGPYQTPGSAKGQATKMTTNLDGSPYGDWTASIYRLDPETLTLVEV